MRVWRFAVRPAEGQPDPLGRRVAAMAGGGDDPLEGVAGVATARVYLVEAALSEPQAARLGERLLADPVAESIGDADEPPGAAAVEVHFKPGVMDPVARSVESAAAAVLGGESAPGVRVMTGMRYVFEPAAGGAVDARDAEAWAHRHLANDVVQQVHVGVWWPERFPASTAYELRRVEVPIRELDDDQLKVLSREGHLFLSLDEMRAIREHYRGLGREPSDIELETLAQTWSEHCVHKTLKSTVRVRHEGTGARRHEGDRAHAGIKPRPSAASGPADADPDIADPLAIFRGKAGHDVHDDGSVTIHNLLKSTIAAATETLKQRDPELADWLVSVFVDNSGIVRFDDTHGVCIKVETHNHPSALEPYGGAATGIGGCIRDIMGTGLAATPIANTDVFCVGSQGILSRSDVESQKSNVKNQTISLLTSDILPSEVIPPRRVLQRVVDGVRDYGNRMGIPTVNGAVVVDPDYVGNPLVFVGCIGVIPLDRCFGDPQPGDRIIALGGATGRDGIHGATFSSAELTEGHADEFGHAVQIGNAITQKKTLDVILQARDHPGGCLFSSITDCGAGGFSSAVGEMGEKVGAVVDLDAAPLKYDGLSYTEVWISEAQERMVLAVPPHELPKLRALCEAEDVLLCDLGAFGHGAADDPQLELRWHGQTVGELPMGFVHDGLPMPTREATLPTKPRAEAQPKPRIADPHDLHLGDALRDLLGHPNIASKHWIIRQYDHEVQGASVVKPLVGPLQIGPSDASVVRPKLDSHRGLAIGCGLAPHLSEKATTRGLASDADSYQATLHALDEAVRNVVCVGGDPARTAVLDNFCWPSCDDPAQLGSVVLAAEACHDAALAYGTPFVSGKDSLSNQFTSSDGRLITIPPTMLITAMAIVPDTRRCVTMDAKAPGHRLLLIGDTDDRLGGSHLLNVRPGLIDQVDPRVPRVDLDAGPRHARLVARLIAAGHVAAAHDASDGGLLVAAAEMAFAGGIGLDLDLAAVGPASPLAAAFAESPSRYLLAVPESAADAVEQACGAAGVACSWIGGFAEHAQLRVPGAGVDVALDTLVDAWRRPLDW